MRVPLEERANYVSRSEYMRAYTLIEGAESAEKTVDAIYARLEGDAEEGLVLDPKFIALLALFCESGRSLARAMLSTEELSSLQFALASEFVGVRMAFPHLAAPDSKGGS